jgi:hypothetical protein
MMLPNFDGAFGAGGFVLSDMATAWMPEKDVEGGLGALCPYYHISFHNSLGKAMRDGIQVHYTLSSLYFELPSLI